MIKPEPVKPHRF